MTARIIILCVWLVSLPLGYVTARWSNRSMGCGKWTRNDRLFAILFSLLYGPFMPVFAVLVALLWKLQDSKWGNQEAKW